jgi:hypothetical protein
MAEFLGKYVAAPIVACILIWKAATEIWAGAGVWVIIIPVVIAGAAFYLWQRTTRRSAHPWE